jgi:hypothetical protein
MIIVRIVGGLGNQMFQYAYAKSLQEKGFDVKIDISKFKTYKLHGGYQLDDYNIDLEKAGFFDTFLALIKLKKNVKEKGWLFNDKLFRLSGNEFVKGYFQNEKYFKEIRETLLMQFQKSGKKADSTEFFSEQIRETASNCSLHVRRGDYVSNTKNHTIHGVCDLEYYKIAVEFILSKEKQTTFFVFSDDISWTKENLKIENAIYVDHKCTPQEDIYLMSLCRNNITANSSFSWWGAWLNKNKEKIVISPKQWYVSKETNIICDDWIKF